MYDACRPDGCRRCIEVKGRARTGDIEVSTNEWIRASNLRHEYWLYTVFDCVGNNPRLVRVRDPYNSLLAKAIGGVLIGAQSIFSHSEEV